VEAGRSSNLAEEPVFSAVAVAEVLAATYFFIAACSGLKGRGLSFCLPELAPFDCWDKVVAGLPPDSESIVFVPEINSPSLKGAVAFELSKLEFCGLLLAAETAEFAKFGKGKNLLLAACFKGEDGCLVSSRRALISSNKPLSLTNDEFKKFCSELERLN